MLLRSAEVKLCSQICSTSVGLFLFFLVIVELQGRFGGLWEFFRLDQEGISDD